MNWYMGLPSAFNLTAQIYACTVSKSLEIYWGDMCPSSENTSARKNTVLGKHEDNAEGLRSYEGVKKARMEVQGSTK